MKTTAPSEMLDYKGAHVVTGLAMGTLYAFVHQKRIPHIRLSRRLVRFRRADLELWLAERAVPAASASR